MGQVREKAFVYDTGDIVEIDAAPARKKGSGRRASWQHTTEGQRWINARARARYVTRLLQLNFSFGAMLYTLTYDDEHLPDDIDGAKKDFRAFIRKVRDRYKKDKIVLKYMAVVGVGEDSGRVHIHVVQTGGMDRGELLGLWRKSHGIWEDALVGGEWGYQDIAGYIMQNGAYAENYEHSYMRSRNLTEPEPEPEESRLQKQVDSVMKKSFCEQIMRGDMTRQEINAKFPGFRVLDLRPSDCRYNPYNRGYIVHLRLIRAGARLPDWATTRNQKDWMESFADLYLRCIEERKRRLGESLPEENQRLYGALRERWEELKKEGRNAKQRSDTAQA